MITAELYPIDRPNVPLFNGVPDHEVSLLLQHGQFRHYRVGETIFEEDTEESCLYLVVHGEVGEYVDGRLTRVCRCGDAFGENGVLQRKPRVSSALAMTRSDIIRIDGGFIRGQIEQGRCSRLLLNLAQLLSNSAPSPQPGRRGSRRPRAMNH